MPHFAPQKADMSEMNGMLMAELLPYFETVVMALRLLSTHKDLYGGGCLSRLGPVEKSECEKVHRQQERVQSKRWKKRRQFHSRTG